MSSEEDALARRSSRAELRGLNRWGVLTEGVLGVEESMSASHLHNATVSTPCHGVSWCRTTKGDTSPGAELWGLKHGGMLTEGMLGVKESMSASHLHSNTTVNTGHSVSWCRMLT